MRNNDFIAFPMQAVDRLFCPMCDEAVGRQLRLQIIDEESNINRDGIRTLCVALHSTLFDNLTEADLDVVEIYANLESLFCNDEITGMYFYLCMLYGLVGEVIPEQLQWLAANEDALHEYCSVCLELHYEYMCEDGLLDENGGSGLIDGRSNIKNIHDYSEHS